MADRPADVPVATWIGAVIDCADPERLATFWREILGGTVDERTRTADWISLAGIEGAGSLSFQRVPEGKSRKNRLHIDLAVDDLGLATARAESVGASRLGGPVDEPTNRVQVMQDPEGNEFCFVVWLVRPST